MEIIRQRSFVSGEWSPTLYDRDDLDGYFSALSRCHGFIVTKHGAVTNRPGTTVVRARKFVDKKTRLIPFYFGDGQAFMLEFGDLYIRFHQHGGTVMDGDVPYEIVSPFSESILPRLKWSQSLDVITLCGGDKVYELSRHSNVDWTITEVSFAAPASVFPSGPTASQFVVRAFDLTYGQAALGPTSFEYAITALLRQNTGRLVETLPYRLKGDALLLLDGSVAPAWAGGTTYGSGDTVTYSGASYVSLQAANVGHSPLNSPTWWQVLKVGNLIWDENHRPSLTWEVPYTVGHGGKNHPPPSLPDFSILEYRVYKGSSTDDPEGPIFNFITSIVLGLAQSQVTFSEVTSAVPDVTRQPPTGEDPFVEDAPTTVSIFDQRRVFGRRNALYLSKVGDFYNFERPLTVLDDSPIIDLEFASSQYEEIRWQVALRALLVGGSCATPWVVGGAAGARDPLTATSFSARANEKYGSSWLDPLVIGSSVLFVQDTDNLVRGVLFDFGSDGYQSEELSIMSGHLFDGHTLAASAYALAPFSVGWYVRDDGVLLGLTYLREHKIFAWHWHDTQGQFEDVATILEDGMSAVYVSTVRTLGDGSTVRYIERFANRILSRLPDGTADFKRGVFLDCAMQYDGVPVTTLGGLDHLEGLSVMALLDGDVAGPFTVTEGAIDVSEVSPDGVSLATVGLVYTSEIHLLPAAQPNKNIRNTQKSTVKVEVALHESRGLEVASAEGKEWKEWAQRSVGAGYAALPLFSGQVKITVPGGMNPFGGALLRHIDPLPITITSVTREIELGQD